jgi:hypothetical protein
MTLGDTARPTTSAANRTVPAINSEASRLPRLKNALAPSAPTVRAAPETAIPPAVTSMRPLADRRTDSSRTEEMLRAVGKVNAEFIQSRGAPDHPGGLARSRFLDGRAGTGTYPDGFPLRTARLAVVKL